MIKVNPSENLFSQGEGIGKYAVFNSLFSDYVIFVAGIRNNWSTGFPIDLIGFPSYGNATTRTQQSNDICIPVNFHRISIACKGDAELATLKS